MKAISAILSILGLLASSGALAAPQQKAPAKKAIPRTGTPTPAVTSGEDEKVAPDVLWPARLEKLAGRYVFVQVASPGGLWEITSPPDAIGTTRQVSINELPAALREKLIKAEVIISGLKLPVAAEAFQRTSPSRRGKLRYFSETASGRLTMRNLPGIGGREDDAGDYSGPVVFTLAHNSHSNPSVAGILDLRTKQEITWGAATIDYADLSADPIPQNAQNPQNAAGDKEKEQEGEPVMANARVLRSGMEIFAYVEWRQSSDDGSRKTIRGCVRLFRAPEGVAPK